MNSLRNHIERLDKAGDLLRVSERVHWDGEVARTGMELLDVNGPAVLFEDTGKHVRLVNGIYAGRDQFHHPDHHTWSRLRAALSISQPSYESLLHAVAWPTSDTERECIPGDHQEFSTDLHSLGLPTSIEGGGRSRVELAILCVRVDGETKWIPTSGIIQDTGHLTLSVPKLAWDLIDESSASGVAVAIGTPPPVIISAVLRWISTLSNQSAISIAQSFAPIDLLETDAGQLPSESELILLGEVSSDQCEPVSAPVSRWELASPHVSFSLAIDRILGKSDPIVPSIPRSATGRVVPMADDIFITSIVQSASLYRRVNDYWGVTPVQWIQIPVEANLGMCIVSSEILYAGFQWQLANTLFSFSRLFDKVLLLDKDANPIDLAGALDDMWVKAYPSQDWTFSESTAPRATAPSYSKESPTGSRLYIDATWDPNWVEEYIAPRVTFENSFPEEIREQATRLWEDETRNV